MSQLSTLPIIKCTEHPSPSRNTRKKCDQCKELHCSRCARSPKVAGRQLCARCANSTKNRKKNASDTSNKTCSRCHVFKPLDAFEENSRRCNKCRQADKGRKKVRTRPATAEGLQRANELNTRSAELSALATTSPSPSSLPLKSFLRKHYHISAADIDALRCADPQTLRQLLRPEDDCVHDVFTLFVKALESGRLQLWDGGAQKMSWPGKDYPQLLRKWDCGLPKNLDRLCINTIINASKNETILAYRQSGFAKAAVLGAEHSFNVTKSLYNNDPNEVYWAFDVSVIDEEPLTLTPPECIVRNQIMFTPNTVLYQKANVTPKYTFVDAHISKSLSFVEWYCANADR